MLAENDDRRSTREDILVLRAAVEQSRMAIVVTDPRRDDNPIVQVNAAFTELTGYAEHEAVGRNCRFLQGPDTDRAEVRRLREAIEARREASVELLNYRRDGTPFWNAFQVSPVLDENGEVIRHCGTLWDVTERVEALGALEGHGRLADRRLQSAIDEVRRLKVGLDDAREAVVITEYAPIEEPGPRIVYVSKGFERITGYTATEVIGANPRILQGPGTDRGSLDTVREHLQTDRSLRSRTLNYRKDGTPFHLEWSITPIHDGQGNPTHWLSVQRDVSDEVEAEDRQRLLTRELNHRVRNLFSLVLGMVRAPAGADQSAAEYQAELTARLRALVEAHGLVFDSTSEDGTPGEGARMDELAGAVLRPLGGEDRVRLAGDSVRLGSRQSLNAALLLHELGTNAVKHGALSTDEGHVEVSWHVEGHEVRLDWTESGGPPVADGKPGRRGFGSQLIAMMVGSSAREDAGLEHRPEGLRCRVSLSGE